MNWDSISKEQLNRDFLEEYGDQINWDIVSSKGLLSEDIIHAFAHKINWKHLCSAQPLSTHIINQYTDHIDWEILSKSPFLTENHMNTYKNNLNWRLLSQNQKFPFSLIVSHMDTIYIPMLYKNKNTSLTEEEWETVKNMKFEYFQSALMTNTVIWENVAFDTFLPMDLLETYADQIDWRGVAIYQDISFSFIEKHIDKIDPILLRINRFVSFSKNEWFYLENLRKKQNH